MKRLHKFRLKYLLVSILTTFLFFTQTWKSAGNYVYSGNFYSTLTNYTDTVPVKPITDSSLKKNLINNKDSSIKSKPDSSALIIPSDSSILKSKTDTFLFKVSKDSLDAPVTYEAEDSAVVLVKGKKVILYGKTKTNYKTIELVAPKQS